MTGLISFTGNKQQYQNLKSEIDDAVQEVLASGSLLAGPKARELEELLAKQCQRKYAVALNSCTTALQCIMNYIQGLRYKIPHQNQSFRRLCTTNLSYMITGSVAERLGPVHYTDVDHNGLMKIDDIPYRDVDCIMTVNLFGQVVDYHGILINCALFNEHKTFVIEDAAQSLGSSFRGLPSGKLGWASVFSFDPTKVLNCSTGGLILTDDEQLANYADLYRSTRLHSAPSQNHNLKITEIDAAMLLAKMPYLESWQKRRTDIANYYKENIQNVETLVTPDGVISNWSRFPIVLSNSPARDLLQNYLDTENIEHKIHYNYFQQTTSYLKNPDENYPGVIRYMNRSLSIPLYAELTDSEVMRITETINSFTKHQTSYATTSIRKIFSAQ